MGHQLAELLFKDYRRRVLGLLLLHPDKAYHVREIARLTGTVAGTLHKELSRLAEAEILLKRASGNQVLYQANRDGLIYEELASILCKTSGEENELAYACQRGRAGEHTIAGKERNVRPEKAQKHMEDNMTHESLTADGLSGFSREELLQLVKRYHIRHLSLFGSAARGELGPDSDIDLLVEFEKGKEPSLGGMVEIQDAFETLFGRRVDLATPTILNNPYRRRAIEKDMKELYAA